MLAVDTNVLVRFLTHDEPDKTARAVRLMESPRVWIAKTVLLETEWVLRTLYGFPAERIAGALRGLAGLGNVDLEESEQVARAIDGYEAGLDFADALHLASAGGRRFASFDERFVKRACRAGVANVVSA